MRRLGLLLALAATTTGCPDQPDPYFRDGIDLQEVTFTVTDTDMGIFPNESVLDDEGNPFRNVPIDLDAKFLINDEGNNAAGFYSWATVLARQPTGEHQFYTGTKLQGLYESREVANEELETVRDMAIRAYQSVLDNFPASVTYDETGTIAYPLAPGAYYGIVSLGGTPEGGWVVVSTPDGGATVVQVGEE
jgi:hypothetical protein